MVAALREQVLQALEQIKNHHRQTEGGSADDVIEMPSMLAAIMWCDWRF